MECAWERRFTATDKRSRPRNIKTRQSATTKPMTRTNVVDRVTTRKKASTVSRADKSKRRASTEPLRGSFPLNPLSIRPERSLRCVHKSRDLFLWDTTDSAWSRAVLDFANRCIERSNDTLGCSFLSVFLLRTSTRTRFVLPYLLG